ncbi:hypothetical protein K438DRAFT_1977885 [Mycena galopus ATCC 62051]|nr:hypothetical protein K438DRAFT_1977885 [Mycena galopus ATCC 62051]
MPELPSELEREIFRLAFRSSGRDTRVPLKLTLCLVARRVQFWIDPLSYALVTLKDELHAGKFLGLIQSNLKSPDFFKAVETLCISFKVAGATACGILSACTQVRSLACWVDMKDSPELPFLVSRLPLHRLSIEIGHFSNIPVAPSTSIWLSELTHIELIPWRWRYYSDQVLSNLCHLPSLTHVAFDPGKMNGTGRAAMICSCCSCLQVLILLETHSEPMDDYRVVLGQRKSNLVEDWEAPYFGLEDVWSRAQTIADQQKVEALSLGNG